MNESNKILLIIILIAAVVLIAVLTILITVLVVTKKNKNKKIIIDDTFIDELFNILGSKENIMEVTVDNGRLKFKVNDLDVVKLDDLKRISTSGVFVTGNVIKTLFKLDSFDIKKAIDKKL